eukprot:3232357-Rhodomonas_salina.1
MPADEVLKVSARMATSSHTQSQTLKDQSSRRRGRVWHTALPGHTSSTRWTRARIANCRGRWERWRPGLRSDCQRGGFCHSTLLGRRRCAAGWP